MERKERSGGERLSICLGKKALGQAVWFALECGEGDIPIFCDIMREEPVAGGTWIETR